MIGQVVYSLQSLMASSTASASCDPSGATKCDTGLPGIAVTTTQLQQILQITFGIFAAVAVLMIVISGLNFITAQGNPQETAKARNTIIYSVIGLVIALSAETIVSFAIGKV